jgi:Uma2 family endonuclease
MPVARLEDTAMVTRPRYTAEELPSLTSDEEDFELIEGALVRIALPGFDHGAIQANVGTLLHIQVEERALGTVVGRAGFILARGPDTVLAPDVAFIASSRFPGQISGFAEFAPDAAVVIVSPSNSPGEIERKVAVYLQTGVRAIWVVYPEEQQVVVHTPHPAPSIFGAGEAIEGDEVLPGLSLPVAEIFA